MQVQEIINQNTISVTTSSRPKRVAFLVHLGQTTDEEINQIIQYSVGVWGGRYHAIIPTTGKEIASDWWKLLVLVDPDIVYSFVPLDDCLVYRINRHILPLKIVEITSEDRKRKGTNNLISDQEIRSLGIEDIPRFIWARRGSIREPLFFYIKDSWGNTAEKTFVLRNFGTLPDIISMQTTFRDIPHKVLEPNSFSPTDILKELHPHASLAILPIDLCRMCVPQYYPGHDRFAQGFHLVIGDSPMDTAYAWNRIHVSNNGRSRCTFWLSRKLSHEDDLLYLVGLWIKTTFWNPYEKNGKVVSYSVNQESLLPIAEKIQEVVDFVFEPIHLTPEQFPCPNSRSPRMPFPERHTCQVPLCQNRGIVGFPRPPFLVEGHPEFGWMVDCEIPYHRESYWYTNAVSNWQLPKRIGIADKFFESYGHSRVIAGGLPSTEVWPNSQAIKIYLPSDMELIRTYLDRQYSNMTGRQTQPEGRFASFRVSSNGKYLQGLLELFGSLSSACSTFEDPSWRAVFLLMAGRPDPEADLKRRTELAVKVFRDIFAEDPSPVDDNGPRLEKLAREIAHRLTLRDPDPRVLSSKQLKGQYFKNVRAGSLKQNPKVEYRLSNKEIYDVELQDLLDAGVLLQGSEVECPYCGTRHWYVIDDLHSEMRCNGCMLEFSFPVAPEWSFKLNALITNALRRQGLLAVIQTLCSLGLDTRNMFLFVPCLDIFKKDEREPFTDLDIVVIRDGKSLIAEVKSAPGGFCPKDFKNLREVAEDLLPDEVAVAAPGDKWHQEVSSQITRLEEALRPLEIKVSTIALRWR